MSGKQLGPIFAVSMLLFLSFSSVSYCQIVPIQNMCHCKTRTYNCSDNPVCTDGCADDYMGPRCDFIEAFRAWGANAPENAKIFLDNDSVQETCSSAPTKGPIILSFKQSILFSFAELILQQTVSSHDIDTVLSLDKDIIPYHLISKSMSHILMGRSTRRFQTLVFEYLPSNLCSIKISGGRNVVIGKETVQTSSVSESKLSVDGDDSTCSTTSREIQPTYFLHFSQSVINIITIVNTEDNATRCRLAGFTLNVSRPTGVSAFNYHNEPETVVDEYHVSVESTEELSSISISNKKVAGSCRDGVLELCEVKVFASISCERGSFGFECEETCPEGCLSRACHRVTGKCTFGCKDGRYTGDNCCENGRTGPECDHACDNCKETCTSYGCNEECEPGFVGVFCEERCANGTWGEDCLHTCPLECENNECNHMTGLCPHGREELKTPPSAWTMIILLSALVLFLILTGVCAIKILANRCSRNEKIKEEKLLSISRNLTSNSQGDANVENNEEPTENYGSGVNDGASTLLSFKESSVDGGESDGYSAYTGTLTSGPA